MRKTICKKTHKAPKRTIYETQNAERRWKNILPICKKRKNVRKKKATMRLFLLSEDFLAPNTWRITDFNQHFKHKKRTQTLPCYRFGWVHLGKALVTRKTQKMDLSFKVDSANLNPFICVNVV